MRRCAEREGEGWVGRGGVRRCAEREGGVGGKGRCAEGELGWWKRETGAVGNLCRGMSGKLFSSGQGECT